MRRELVAVIQSDRSMAVSRITLAAPSVDGIGLHIAI
jgi:hypothetical protein